MHTYKLWHVRQRRAWYVLVVAECQTSGCVNGVCNIYPLNLQPGSNSSAFGRSEDEFTLISLSLWNCDISFIKSTKLCFLNAASFHTSCLVLTILHLELLLSTVTLQSSYCTRHRRHRHRLQNSIINRLFGITNMLEHDIYHIWEIRENRSTWFVQLQAP